MVPRRGAASVSIKRVEGVEALHGGFKISLAYVYGYADKRDAETSKGLTFDEARRIAANIAKLPTLLAAEK